MLVVVTYDIKDDRRRNRLSKLLKGYGDRVQLSVFECLLEKREFEALKKSVRKVVHSKDDSVLYYALCGQCAARETKSRTQGRPSQQRTIVV